MRTLLTGTCLFASMALGTVSAELPFLQEAPWLGYFAVHESKGYHFKIAAANGKVVLAPLSSKGEPVAERLNIVIAFGLVETLPNGKTAVRPIRADTLESTDPATDKLRKCVIRGKTAGDASLEITIEEARGMIIVGSRVLDPGTLKNPVCPSITAVFPGAEPKSGAPKEKVELDERDAKRAAKKEAKAAEEKLMENVVELKWTDGKRQKLTFGEVVDAGSPEINGPGIAAAELAITAYGGKKISLTAAPNSAMKLANSKPASLNEGFSIQWSPDLAKDKDGQARLALEVK